MKKIAIIHTTGATLVSMEKLIRQEIQEVEVMNILDDSILKDMIAGRKVELVKARWMTYAQIAETAGADAILSACSTVGEFVEEAESMLSVPVIRVDEAMAEEAVRRGTMICVLATLESTLTPTVRLIDRKAETIRKKCKITTVLIEGAYDALMRGNWEEHHKRIEETVSDTLVKADIIVLAQASMAAALEALDEKTMDKILTSPLSGVRFLKKRLGG